LGVGVLNETDIIAWGEEARGPVSGLLLAAGRGERMRPLTDAVAKPALLVGDKPLGAYGLQLLAELGGPIAINLSWLPYETRAALEPYAPPNTLWLMETPEPYGSAGTVAALLSALADTFVVLNADTLTDLRLTDLLATHLRVGAPVTLAVRRVDSGADLEIQDGRAQRYIDRRAEPHAAGAMYIGAAAFERDLVTRLLEPGKVAGLGEAVFAPLANRGEIAVHEHAGFALDVGTPERLAEARRLFNG
jgi:NDP-sugar pyrophosphorylase family protein